MDYGYQLLRHVVQQVLGNIGAAARITILPIFLAYACVAGLYFLLGGRELIDFILGAQTMSQTQIDAYFATVEGESLAIRLFGGALLAIPIFMIFYSWAAIGWHRYVLLEEYPSGFAGRFDGKLIQSYMGAILRMSLMLTGVLILVAIGIGILMAILLPVFGDMAAFELGQIVGVGIGIGFTWVLTRLGLILPSASLGHYMKMGQSWRHSAPVSGQILLPIIVLPIAFLILNTLVGLAGTVGIVLSVAVLWVQTLANLALLTTLYGNLVEGRQLN